MSRRPIPTYFFVVVVVRRGDQVLVVHERKHGQLWYLPAGRVEPGEDFVTAAERETLEETSVPIIVEGILRIEHLPMPDGAARMRVIFLARPRDNTPPKSKPDRDTLGAAWVTIDELDNLPLRSGSVRDLVQYVADGAPVYPLELITYEGAPYRRKG